MKLDSNLSAQSTHVGMGTVMAHHAYGPRAAECLAAIRREAARLEESLSRFLPASEISRVNRSAGGGSESVSQDTYALLAQALEYAARSQGCFDITIGPLAALWHSARETAMPPDHASIRAALALVDYRDLLLDPSRRTAGLRQVGQSVDLGGIGKGFAGERFLEIYQEYGILSAYSNIGGNVVTLGGKPDGAPWQIGIQHPRQEDRLIGSVAVTGKSVVTSGDYQRYFIDRQGIRRHHILNPASGYPAESGLISVSIVAENAMQADALSTMVFVAGLEPGLDLLRDYPGAEAVLVDQRLQVFITPGLEGSFQPEQGARVRQLSDFVWLS